MGSLPEFFLGPGNASEVLRHFRQLAREAGLRAWLVGGTVRDMQLGRPSPDVDVVLAAGRDVVYTLCVALARRLGISRFALSPEFGTERLVYLGGHLDVSPLRGKVIEEDLAERDFTINAMAIPIEGGPLVDPFEGVRDLRRRLIRLVSDHAFQGDPVRLMRAVRLAHGLGFRVSRQTVEAARRDAFLLGGAAPERLLSEVVATLDLQGASAAVRLWDKLGILEQVFPEVASIKGVCVARTSSEDLFAQTLSTLDQLDLLIAEPERVFGDVAPFLSARLARPVDGAVSRPAALRLAVLLHYAVSTEASTSEKASRRSELGSAQDGLSNAMGSADPPVVAICRRLRTSRAVMDLATRIIWGSSWFYQLGKRGPLGNLDRIDFLWRVAPWEPEVLLTSVADVLARQGSLVPDAACSRLKVIACELMRLWAERERQGVRPLPVRGDELALALGIEPSPTLGKLIRQLRLEWEAGELARDPKAVVARARELLTSLDE